MSDYQVRGLTTSINHPTIKIEDMRKEVFDKVEPDTLDSLKAGDEIQVNLIDTQGSAALAWFTLLGGMLTVRGERCYLAVQTAGAFHPTCDPLFLPISAIKDWEISTEDEDAA